MKTTMDDRICIVLRHGDYHQLADTPSAHQPFGLNSQGRCQSMDAVDRVKQMVARNGWSLNPIAHSSSLRRAWETAKIVVDHLESCSKILQTDRLTERCVGSGANLTRRQIADAVAGDPRFPPLPADWKADSHYRLPFIGAESLMESGKRVAEYLTETMNSDCEPNQAILFFGHGASIRHAAHHLGVLEFERLAGLSMHHAQPVALAVSPDGHWWHVDGDWKNRTVASAPMD
jgi:2,3-bisphosphoglycerate-dependent phosphoglycerate mutase